jgi:SET and MYND domain-containing protein
MRATDIVLPPAQARTWRLAWSESRGTHGLAVRDLAPGELVLEETARATAVTDRWRERVCHVCFRRSPALAPCPGCGRVWTCSAACREQLAPIHDRECAALEGLAATGDLDQLSIRMALRLLATGPGAGEAEPMEHLVTNRERLPDYRLEVYAQQTERLLQLLPAELRRPPEELIDLRCRIHVNAFAINRDGVDSRGLAMNDLAPLLNHACAPTCHFVQEDARMRIRCIQPVAAGEELTVSYLHPYLSRRVRRAKLRTGHFFDCACARCTDPRPDLLGAYLCPVPGCNGTLARVSGAPVHRCDACGEEQSSMELRRQEATLRTRYEEDTWLPSEREAVREARPRLELLLQLAEQLLHPLHELRHRIECTLAEVCAVAGDPRESLCHLEPRLRALEQVVPRYHGLIAQQHQRLASQLWRLGTDPRGPIVERREALDRCFQALATSLLVRTISCGSDHPEAQLALSRMRQVHEARLALRSSPGAQRPS